jgi:predicted 2-oxoglutarate/Fe(II)-dependent dioxygenase YbiX
VYRNNSSLHMHVDKVKTHVISCILHVDHSEDSEPWPIFIEDFQGNTNEVVLESGDLMFYESSKCIHGRPRKFKGSWCKWFQGRYIYVLYCTVPLVEPFLFGLCMLHVLVIFGF